MEELVRTFIKNEDHNFSLFNYVNEQNNEIEKYEEQIQALREEERKFAQESTYMFRGYSFVMLLSYFILIGALGNPGLLLSCSIMTISLYITSILIITPKSLYFNHTLNQQSTINNQQVEMMSTSTSRF